MNAPARIVLVDDDPDLLCLVRLRLEAAGHEVEALASAEAALAALAARRADLLLTDWRLPGMDGLQLFETARRRYPTLPVILFTAHGTVPDAVEAVSRGVFCYLEKPFDGQLLLDKVAQGLALSAGDGAAGDDWRAGIVSRGPAMEELLSEARMVAATDASVLLQGESGSGKEVLARAIHQASRRAGRPFVAVNCGAIPESLMESEFFGCRKGAFTGADADRDGFFQQAQGGTLFLDEVAELPLAMQVKLLRAIQEKTVRKLGASQEEAVDARIICATHRDLAARVESGQFRQDLYYRLNVLPLRMPPLRELRDDIPLFAERLLQRFGGASAPQLSADARRALQDYAYPGNFRELENILERAVALAAGPALSREDLQLTPCAEHAPEPGSGEPLQDYLDRVEREAIVKALEGTRYNRTQAAKKLGVTFRSLRYRMERLGVK